MSLKEKIGQLFIHTVAPLETQQNRKNIQDAVKEYKIGGLLFSGGEWVKQVRLTNYAQEMADIPLLLTFDGEWGLAMRLKGIPAFPRNRVLGCITDNNLLYEYGKEVAWPSNGVVYFFFADYNNVVRGYIKMTDGTAFNLANEEQVELADYLTKYETGTYIWFTLK